MSVSDPLPMDSPISGLGFNAVEEEESGDESDFEKMIVSVGMGSQEYI